MLSKDTDNSPIPALEPWMSTTTEFSFNAMSTATLLSKSSVCLVTSPQQQQHHQQRNTNSPVLPSPATILPSSSPSSVLPVSSASLPISSPRLPASFSSTVPCTLSAAASPVAVPVSSPRLPVSLSSHTKLPNSSSHLPVSSPTLPQSSPTLPTSGILSPSQIKQEPISSILVNELLSRDSLPTTCYSALQAKNTVVCKREPSEIKAEHNHHHHHSTPSVRVKEEYPDLCDMVGVDKTTYLEFLNNPILPSISEVEQLLEQCSDSPMSHCRPRHLEHLPTAVANFTCKTEPLPQRHLAAHVPHDSSLSPSYQAPYIETSFTEDDPTLWPQNDLTPLIPMHAHDYKHQEIKSDVAWSHDMSNGGYDSCGPIESPRSTGSLESEEGESRLPTAVENMDDVGVMTSQLEESHRLAFDDDFGSFEVDEKAFKKRRKGLHLWEFLLEVLDDDRYVPHLLYWVERSKGIFKIEKSQEVAKLWGRRKQRSHMTYEHMSRAMRHYYSSGIMRRIPGKRLMYQFGPRAFATSKTSP